MLFNARIRVLASMVGLAVLSALGIWLFLSLGWGRDSYLPAPEADNAPLPPSEYLADMLRVGGGDALIVRRVHISRHDKHRFLDLMPHVAPLRGWFADRNYDSISLVLPVADLGELDRIEAEPVVWMLASLNSAQRMPPAEPPEYVHVLVKADGYGYGLGFLWVLLLFACIIVCALSLAFTLWELISPTQALADSDCPDHDCQAGAEEAPEGPY